MAQQLQPRTQVRHTLWGWAILLAVALNTLPIPALAGPVPAPRPTARGTGIHTTQPATLPTGLAHLTMLPDVPPHLGQAQESPSPSILPEPTTPSLNAAPRVGFRTARPGATGHTPWWAWVFATVGTLALGATTVPRLRRNVMQTRPTSGGGNANEKGLPQIIAFSVTLLLGVVCLMIGIRADVGGFLANSWVLKFLIPLGAVLILVGVVIGISVTVSLIKKHIEKKKREREAAERQRQQEAQQRRQQQQQAQPTPPATNTPAERPASTTQPQAPANNTPTPTPNQNVRPQTPRGPIESSPRPVSPTPTPAPQPETHPTP